MVGLTRGPLAAEVYWRRRLLFLGLALLLVLGLSRVLGGGSDASDGAAGNASAPVDTAAQVGAAASVTPDPTVPVTPTASTAEQVRQAKKAARAEKKAAAAAAAAKAAAAAAAALPDPQGPCADTDIVVTPSVPAPVAGADVAIDLELRTSFSPACTWKVSPDTLAVKLTSGPDDIWSTQQCPAAVPTQDVVLRRAAPTMVQVVWSSKRSDESCSARTDWALPGFYHVYAAALAGEPSDVQFELVAPAPATIIETAVPQPQGTGGKNAGKKTGKNPATDPAKNKATKQR